MIDTTFQILEVYTCPEKDTLRLYGHCIAVNEFEFSLSLQNADYHAALRRLTGVLLDIMTLDSQLVVAHTTPALTVDPALMTAIRGFIAWAGAHDLRGLDETTLLLKEEG